MNHKNQYKTKHRDELLTFLEAAPGKHITIHEICEHFKQAGTPIGTTTIYRQLERMVDEGLVNKYVIDGNSAACFAYVGHQNHMQEGTCFHLKCEKCGRLIHLKCEELERLQSHILEDHDFLINPMRTVFYGICSDCDSHMDKTGIHPRIEM